MSLQTQETELNLNSGFVQKKPFRKEGARSTLYATFVKIKSPVFARLQHSTDGENWAEIDESAVEIAENAPVYTQAWTENVLPEGTMLRMVVEPSNAVLLNIKLLSA